MKLLVQADDFGFTRAVTYGIVDCIDLGVVRNTGLFANMPCAEFAVSFMKDRSHVCFGIDFNIVSGPCCANPSLIPHLVDKDGNFIRSSQRMSDPRIKSEEGRKEMFPYEEVYCELKAQYQRFVDLTGKQPGYLHEHSLPVETYVKAIRQISQETGIVFSEDAIAKYDIAMWLHNTEGTMKKEFDPLSQLHVRPFDKVIQNQAYLLSHEYAMIGGHAGYVDEALLHLSSLSLERFKDAQMLMSDTLNEWIKTHEVELITYADLK